MPRSFAKQNSAKSNPRNGFEKAEAAGTEAGCNGFISFLLRKKLTAQKRHGGRF
jgi:hypothetical protein